MANYSYDPNLNRYRNLATGRFVAEAEVLAWVDDSIKASSIVTDGLTQVLADNRTAVSVWQEAMRRELKDEYIRQYMLGKGGITQMTQADWGSVGGMLKEQYQYLDQLAADIAAGNLSEDGLRVDGRYFTTTPLHFVGGQV